MHKEAGTDSITYAAPSVKRFIKQKLLRPIVLSVKGKKSACVKGMLQCFITNESRHRPVRGYPKHKRGQENSVDFCQVKRYNARRKNGNH
jgi:hypothetical protein